MYKYYAKLFALKLSPLFVGLGVHKMASFFLGGHGHIIMLHRVIPEVGQNRIHNHLSLEVTPEKLEEIITFFIGQKYDVISLDKIDEYQKKNKKFVVFTFDDGYKDNIEFAYPVFKKFNCPFAIYVCNAFPNGNAFIWWYLLEELLLKLDFISIQTKNFKFEKNISTSKKKEAAFYIVRDAINKGTLPLDQFKALAEQWGLDWKEKVKKYSLSWDEIIALSQDPLVTIGGHTLSHLALKGLSADEVSSEVKRAKDELEFYVQKNVEHFAYPFGSRKEVSQRDVKLVRKMGFKTATTTILGNIKYLRLTDMHQLPRITVNAQTSLSVLKMQMSGLYSIIDNRFKGCEI